MPVILLGEFTASDKQPYLKKLLRLPSFGRMFARDPCKQEWPGERCGFDNGAWTCYVKGLPFDGDKFLRRLDQMQKTIAEKCLACAAVPDIVAGGKRSLDFSLEWIEKLPPLKRWCLVVQDGMTVEMVEPHLDKFGGLFLGGTDQFKRTAAIWRELARQHRKWSHYGRCSTIARIRDAIQLGYDSLDSSRPVRCWVGGQRGFTKAWVDVATGADRQKVLL